MDKVPTMPDVQELWVMTTDLLDRAREESDTQQREALCRLAIAHATAMQAGMAYIKGFLAT